jgi:FtsH-binding integral membrane protein
MERQWQATAARTGAATQEAIDEGLRSYMLRVYNYMASGLLLTAISAMAVANVEALRGLFYHLAPNGAPVGMTILGWIVVFAPLLMVFALSGGINRMSATAAQAVFWVFSTLIGASLAHLLFVYTGSSIGRAFAITAVTFGAMSLYGYTTKRDLTGMGSFLFMGLIGLVIAMLVNIFLQSTMMQFIISIIGVLIFTGLTAYDTQQIKQTYYAGMGAQVEKKSAIMGALRLYLDFLNLFLMLLSLFGNRQ